MAVMDADPHANAVLTNDLGDYQQWHVFVNHLRMKLHWQILRCFGVKEAQPQR